MGGLGRRVAHLEAKTRETLFRQAAERMATATGLDIEEVLAETRRLAARLEALTARHGAGEGTRRWEAEMAAEAGMSVAELRAELARLEERLA